jgi:hypothetical protein
MCPISSRGPSRLNAEEQPLKDSPPLIVSSWNADVCTVRNTLT